MPAAVGRQTAPSMASHSDYPPPSADIGQGDQGTAGQYNAAMKPTRRPEAMDSPAGTATPDVVGTPSVHSLPATNSHPDVGYGDEYHSVTDSHHAGTRGYADSGDEAAAHYGYADDHEQRPRGDDRHAAAGSAGHAREDSPSGSVRPRAGPRWTAPEVGALSAGVCLRCCWGGARAGPPSGLHAPLRLAFIRAFPCVIVARGVFKEGHGSRAAASGDNTAGRPDGHVKPVRGGAGGRGVWNPSLLLATLANLRPLCLAGDNAAPLERGSASHVPGGARVCWGCRRQRAAQQRRDAAP